MSSDWYDSVKENANSFAIGNLNKFQVSPFAPQSLSGVEAGIDNVSSIISTFLGQLSTIIDLTTYTLSISTIVPITNSLDPSQTVTMNAATLNFNADNINVMHA